MRRERHTLYRSALFILAHVDKAPQGWAGARSIVIAAANADEAKYILAGDAKYARGDPRELAASVWPSGVIQGHITVFWWHSVSNTSLEMMRADEQLCRRSLYKDHPFARIINFAEVAGPSATFTDVRTAERVAFSRVN